MTEGSLKLTDTALISRSWTAITSTFPWHQSVIAFCQLTTLRGSYEAFRRSVCSMTAFMITGGRLSCLERQSPNTSEHSELHRYEKRGSKAPPLRDRNPRGHERRLRRSRRGAPAVPGSRTPARSRRNHPPTAGGDRSPRAHQYGTPVSRGS